MLKHLILWCRDTKGATAIEYGLIMAGISLVLVVSIFAFGDDINALLATLSKEIIR